MKRTLLAAVLMAASAASQAVTWTPTATVTRTEVSNNITGIPDQAVGTTLTIGNLTISDSFQYNVSFTYLGEESGFIDKFYLFAAGSANLLEIDAPGKTVSAVYSANDFNFKFEGNTGLFAINNGAKDPATSIGLIGTNITVPTLPVNVPNTFAFILGYNDSAGSATLGDWDDFVIGVNWSRVPNEIPEPSTYMLMLAGLLGLGFIARRRMN